MRDHVAFAAARVQVVCVTNCPSGVCRTVRMMPLPLTALASGDQRSRAARRSPCTSRIARDAKIDLFGRSGERFFERDLEIVAQIRSALRPAAARLRLGARFAEEHIEDVAEAVGTKARETEVGAALPAPLTRAEAIVLRALLRIGKHFVGFVDLFEAMLGARLCRRETSGWCFRASER